MANDALIRNVKQKKNQEFVYDDTQVRTLLDFFLLISICKTRFWSPTHHSRFLDANTLKYNFFVDFFVREEMLIFFCELYVFFSPQTIGKGKKKNWSMTPPSICFLSLFVQPRR